MSKIARIAGVAAVDESIDDVGEKFRKLSFDIHPPLVFKDLDNVQQLIVQWIL